MDAEFTNGAIRLWLQDEDPDNDVYSSIELGLKAQTGEIFMNTSTQDLFFCASGGNSSQVWFNIAYYPQVQALLAETPQADWAQEDSEESDFIKNKPTARSQSSASRSLNSAFQVSATRESLVNYSVDISTTLTLITGQSGTVFLEMASDSGFTSDVQELSRFVNGNTGTLTIGLSLTQNVTGNVTGYVPAGYYVRLRTENNTGSPTFTYRSGQEVLL